MTISNAVLDMAAAVSVVCAALYAVLQLTEKSRAEKKSSDAALAALRARFLDMNNKLPGKDFGELLERGDLRTVKTGNHGGDFPDRKMLNSFHRYDAGAMQTALVGVMGTFKRGAYEKSHI